MIESCKVLARIVDQAVFRSLFDVCMMPDFTCKVCYSFAYVEELNKCL